MVVAVAVFLYQSVSYLVESGTMSISHRQCSNTQQTQKTKLRNCTLKTAIINIALADEYAMPACYNIYSQYARK